VIYAYNVILQAPVLFGFKPKGPTPNFRTRAPQNLVMPLSILCVSQFFWLNPFC